MSRIRFAVACTCAILFAWAVPSRAYRMIYPTSSGRVYSGQSQSCDDPSGFAYWASSTISWTHSTAGTGADKASALQAAMLAWTNVPNAGYVLAYVGTTTTTPNFRLNDGANTLSWGIDDFYCPSASSSASCLAVTALNVQQTFPFGYRILESDVLFSDYYLWHTNGSDVDVQAIATHELGHSLGIHHTDVTTSPLPTMYYLYNGTEERSLESDDQQALQCSDARYLNPVFYGDHTVTNCRQISGTAWNNKRPNLNTWVAIRDDSTDLLLAQILADGPGHSFIYTPPSSLKNGKVHTITVSHVENGAPLNGSRQRLICHVNFGLPEPPSDFIDTLGKSWSVGNDFHSSMSGYVTHLRYYRAAEETGMHTLKLWKTSTGASLGSVDVDFGSDLTAGWETGKLPGNGISIQAGVDYTVTVTTTGPKQTKTPCGFGPGPITNGPLTATGGRWVEGNGIFPTTTTCSNFWTDVYFDQ